MCLAHLLKSHQTTDYQAYNKGWRYAGTDLLRFSQLDHVSDLIAFVGDIEDLAFLTSLCH